MVTELNHQEGNFRGCTRSACGSTPGEQCWKAVAGQELQAWLQSADGVEQFGNETNLPEFTHQNGISQHGIYL